MLKSLDRRYSRGLIGCIDVYYTLHRHFHAMIPDYDRAERHIACAYRCITGRYGLEVNT